MQKQPIKYGLPRLLIMLLPFVTVLLLLGCAPQNERKSQIDGRKLVWADEFDYSGLPDSSKWGYDLGDGCPNLCGWGNNELQYYTVRREKNARVEGGHLIIEAHKEPLNGRNYSSTRLVSKNKGDWTYGRIEARIQVPNGRGIWPAFWMLPTDRAYGGWPRSGEIDIMEFVGYIPDSLFGTVHTEHYNGMLGTQKSASLHSKTLASEFHVYAIEWTKDKIDFLLDGTKFTTFPNRHSGIGAWPFDLPFHLLLNVAVGGNWGGKKGVDDTAFPQRMRVDYVRVYQ
jgi:beta-glucanase (GH16 family)